MSLALADILYKQSGGSSLDRARQEHRHHGLLFVENVSGSKAVRTLEQTATQLRALPMEVSGRRTGTFHLWHTSARESPICGLASTRHGEGGSTNRVEIILSAADTPFGLLPLSGISLAECLTSIPSLINFVAAEGMAPKIGRGKVEKYVDLEQTWQNTIVFHPSAASQSLFENLRLAPEWVNFVEITTLPNGFILQYRLNTSSPSRGFSLPHACMLNSEEFRFWANSGFTI
jgi:hypothetical protein